MVAWIEEGIQKRVALNGSGGTAPHDVARSSRAAAISAGLPAAHHDIARAHVTKLRHSCSQNTNLHQLFGIRIKNTDGGQTFEAGNTGDGHTMWSECYRLGPGSGLGCLAVARMLRKKIDC